LTNDNWKPALSGKLTTQAADDGIILLDRGSQRVHRLDKVGARILACCDGTNSVQEIVTQLLQEFNVSDEQLASDVAKLLIRLRLLNIVS
jgi:hypothetical protein